MSAIDIRITATSMADFTTQLSSIVLRTQYSLLDNPAVDPDIAEAENLRTLKTFLKPWTEEM